MARKKAVELADQRNFDQARQVLEDMAAAIKATRTKDEELLDIYDRLLEEAKDMEFGEQRYDDYSRKVPSKKIEAQSAQGAMMRWWMICITVR